MLRNGMLGLPKLSKARLSYLQDSTLFLTGPFNCNTMKNSVSFLHKYVEAYANMSMQYSAIFQKCKNDNFLDGNNIFLIFSQNIDCGYTSELPRRGSSNEYPQSMFKSKNTKRMNTPVNPSFTI